MRVLWISALVVVIDQVTKALIVRSMELYESIPLIGDWLKLTYTENPGMAFGIQFGPPGTVTVFSVLATLLVGWYLYSVRFGYWPFRASLAMVLGGAVGNIVDRIFYGVLMGYSGYFQGRVVDFIHVDIGHVVIPEFIPVLGGSYIALFPIWNVADMAIVGGFVGILLFQGAFHRRIVARRAKKASSTDEAGFSLDPSRLRSSTNGQLHPPVPYAHEPINPDDINDQMNRKVDD